MRSSYTQFPLVATHENLKPLFDGDAGDCDIDLLQVLTHYMAEDRKAVILSNDIRLFRHIQSTNETEAGHHVGTGQYFVATPKYWLNMDVDSVLRFFAIRSWKETRFYEVPKCRFDTPELTFVTFLVCRASLYGTVRHVYLPYGTADTVADLNRHTPYPFDQFIDYAEAPIDQPYFVFENGVDNQAPLWYNGITDEMETEPSMFQKHTTSDGRTLLIAQMTDKHLLNTIKAICREIDQMSSLLTADIQVDNPVFSALIPEANSEDVKRKARSSIQVLYSRLVHYTFEASRRNIDCTSPLQRTFGEDKLPGGAMGSGRDPFLLEGAED